MDKELAKLVALTAFRSSADINNLIPLLNEHCSEEESRDFGMAIATASTEINLQILQKVFTMYPELSDEIDQMVRKYGRPF